MRVWYQGDPESARRVAMRIDGDLPQTAAFLTIADASIQCNRATEIKMSRQVALGSFQTNPRGPVWTQNACGGCRPMGVVVIKDVEVRGIGLANLGHASTVDADIATLVGGCKGLGAKSGDVYLVICLDRGATAYPEPEKAGEIAAKYRHKFEVAFGSTLADRNVLFIWGHHTHTLAIAPDGQVGELTEAKIDRLTRLGAAPVHGNGNGNGCSVLC